MNSNNLDRKQDQFPAIFGSYILLDRLNVGGMAEIFRAKNVTMDGIERLVAIKRILPHLAKDPDFANMFLDEARIAFSLHHANIAQLYELEKAQNSPYIVMEYVRGKDLRAIMNRCHYLKKRVPIDIVLSVIAKVCDGLDYAHRKKDLAMNELSIVHRDISPQNIIVSYDGEIKIIDFGIAKAATKTTHTEAGILKGKFGYMSPEQVLGVQVDHRADLFCVGIILYELVTGHRLFAAGSDLSTLRKIRDVEIVEPHHHDPTIPIELANIIQKTLQREPEDRYPYASDILEEIVSFAHQEQIQLASSRRINDWMVGLFAQEMEADRRTLDLLLKKSAALQANFAPPVSTATPPPLPQVTPGHGLYGGQNQTFQQGNGSGLRHAPPYPPQVPFDPSYGGYPKKKYSSAWLAFLIIGLLISLVMLYFLLFVDAIEYSVTDESIQEPTRQTERVVLPEKRQPEKRTSIVPKKTKVKTKATGQKNKKKSLVPTKQTPKKKKITVDVYSNPPGILVFLEGLRLGATPKRIRFFPDKTSYLFVFKNKKKKKKATLRLKKGKELYKVRVDFKK